MLLKFSKAHSNSGCEIIGERLSMKKLLEYARVIENPRIISSAAVHWK